MQSNKASKKILKIAEETGAAAPGTTNAPEAMANPRAPKSSQPKKNETNEMMSAKHRRKVTEPVTPETPNVESSQPPRTMAASAGAGSHSSETARSSQATQEDIAKLAHSYWVARGHVHGSAEEDWLRAERQLKVKL